jgi:hypothetical protein
VRWDDEIDAAADRELRRRAVPPFRPDEDLIGWIGGPPVLEVWRWRWRCRRARRYVRAADLAYRRLPSPRNRAALVRARVLLSRAEAARP